MKQKELTDQEKREIVKEKFNIFFSKVKELKSEEDANKIKKAFELADRTHITQFRRAGKKLPYIIHPIQVAQITMVDMQLGTDTIVAALLHDTVEDSKGDFIVTVEDIEKAFGKDVAIIVNGVTKIKKEFVKNSTQQVESFKKFVHYMAIDKRTAYVKIADRLHNLRTMSEERDNSKMEKTAEALEVYSPLAHGLGLFRIKKEIEDLCFKLREEDEYNKTLKKAKEFNKEKGDFFNLLKNDITNNFSDKGIEIEIKNKQKSLYRAHKKTKDNNKSFNKIHNFIITRIILKNQNNLPEKQQAYLAFSYLSDMYPIKLKTLRDWITIPKSNGFQAIIVDIMFKGVWTEVQIMTERMDNIATVGFAGRYENTYAKNFDVWVKSVNETIENENLTKQETMDLIRQQDREIFALTPMGKRIKLPKGGTVLDFAFKVHTALGFKFYGAEVNGQLVGYDYQVSNNDLVHIIEGTEIIAKEEWINALACPQNRTRFNKYLNKEKQKRVQKGKVAFEKIKSKNKITDKEFTKLLSKFICTDKNELYFRLENKSISEKQIISSISEYRGIFQRMSNMIYGEKNNTIDISDFNPKENFVIKDMHNISIANCCKPIAGDTSIIYKKSKQKFELHRHECEYAKKLNASEGKSTAKVQWNLVNDTDFETTIKFTGVENKGILSKIINIISDKNSINMTSLNIKTDKNRFIGSIDIQVQSKDSLETMLKKIRKIKFLKKVYRETKYKI